jgi:PHP family Zn ribbon phosphoesterase
MLYNQAVLKASEFSILLNLSGADLCSVVGAPTALAIEKVRRGNVKIEPGYDGQYGIVEVFTEEERRGILEPQIQLGLF